MMISVIGSAMIATSMRAAMRFEKLPGVRKNGESDVPSTISPTRATSRSVSQRARQAAPPAAGRSRERPRLRSSGAAAPAVGPLEPSQDDRVGADGERG